PLLAEAKLVLASTLDNEPVAAEAAVRESIEIAADIGADALERAGLRRLLFEVGIRRGRLQEAGGIAFAARVAWLRAGLEPERDASLQADLGLLAAARGDTDEARVCFERSLKALEAEDASMARRLVVVAGYAAALMQQGAWDDANVAFLRVRRLGIETYGPRHPFVADTELNLGQIAGQLGDATTANGHFEAALEILESAADQHGERLALAYAAYAAIALVEGRTAAARVRARRALALLVGIDDAAPLSASVYDVLGTAASFEGRYGLAVQEHRRALQRARTGFGAASPNEAIARAHLADSLALRGQWREARRELDIATPTVVKVFGTEGPHYAEVLVTEAILLGLEGGQPDAARETAERALTLLPAGQAVMVARAHFVLAQAMLAADDRPGAERESALALRSLTDLNLLELANEIEAWRDASRLGV
ncbi:MAG: tetratricopeptide repeat protein, partial [Nannocystaceae bacterium]|nr:tetratricopeptide repeat protein [Nannocystaceae bacterium]